MHLLYKLHVGSDTHIYRQDLVLQFEYLEVQKINDFIPDQYTTMLMWSFHPLFACDSSWHGVMPEIMKQQILIHKSKL